jgi:hypothetical protein
LRTRVRFGNAPEALTDGFEGFTPGDPLKPSLSLQPNSLQGKHQPVGAVDPIEISGHLLTQEASRKPVLWVTLELDCHAALNRHPHAACVGAVEWAHIPEDFLFGERHDARSFRSSGSPGCMNLLISDC